MFVFENAAASTYDHHNVIYSDASSRREDRVKIPGETPEWALKRHFRR
jgi:hypothetical protein